MATVRMDTTGKKLFADAKDDENWNNYSNIEMRCDCVKRWTIYLKSEFRNTHAHWFLELIVPHKITIQKFSPRWQDRQTAKDPSWRELISNKIGQTTLNSTCHMWLSIINICFENTPMCAERRDDNLVQEHQDGYTKKCNLMEMDKSFCEKHLKRCDTSRCKRNYVVQWGNTTGENVVFIAETRPRRVSESSCTTKIVHHTNSTCFWIVFHDKGFSHHKLDMFLFKFFHDTKCSPQELDVFLNCFSRHKMFTTRTRCVSEWIL